MQRIHSSGMRVALHNLHSSAVQQQPTTPLLWASKHSNRARRQLVNVAYRQQPTVPAQVPADQRHQLGPTVLLPLDFYACLGVTRTAGGRAVRDALDRALVKRPEGYFSSDTVALRDLLLRNAAECLLNYDKRRDYDARSSVSGYVVSVSEDHLPGALVLLQESGCNQLVLDLGKQWLAVNTQDVRRRDVRSVMALAHHALAVQGLQQEEGCCMLEGCRHLESALLLIRQSIHGSEHAAVAADLQREVMQLLKDYSPDYCLALLALPLDDLQRQRGHVLLRKLLWELPDDLSPLGADKDEFLAAARGLLTPQEHMDIHKFAPKGSLSIAQRQLLAEAAVAVAFQRRQPMLLLQAAGAFAKLEQTAAAAQEAGVDMCVERACIALLLGNTQKALHELGLAAHGQQEAGSNPTQQAAQQYVLAHCTDRSDLLPGMYALAQCWMQQGILGSFRQGRGALTADQQQQGAGELDLSPWFDSLLVRLVILVLALIANVQQCVKAVLNMPAAAAASLVWIQKQASAGKKAAATSNRTASASSSRQADNSSTRSDSGTATSSSSDADAGRQASSGSNRSASSSKITSSSSATEPAPRRRGATYGNQTASSSSSGEPQIQRAARAALSDAPQRKQQERQEVSRQGIPSSSKPSTLPPAQAAAHQHSQTEASVKAGAGTQQQVASVATQADSSPSYKPVTAVAAAADEQPSLMARARAAAAKGRSMTQHAGGSMEEEEEEDQPGPGPSPFARKRLGVQMSVLEVQMWDTAPEPAGWQAAASKVASVLLVGAALVVVVGGIRQSGSSSAQSQQQGPCPLLFDARG